MLINNLCKILPEVWFNLNLYLKIRKVIILTWNIQELPYTNPSLLIRRCLKTSLEWGIIFVQHWCKNYFLSQWWKSYEITATQKTYPISHFYASWLINDSCPIHIYSKLSVLSKIVSDNILNLIMYGQYFFKNDKLY